MEPMAARLRRTADRDDGAVNCLGASNLTTECQDRVAQCSAERNRYPKRRIEVTDDRNPAKKHATGKRHAGQEGDLVRWVPRFVGSDEKG
jgi:hypothetical protein